MTVYGETVGALVMSSQVGNNYFLTLQCCRHPGEKPSSSVGGSGLSISLLLKWFEQIYHNPHKSLNEE